MIGRALSIALSALLELSDVLLEQRSPLVAEKLLQEALALSKQLKNRPSWLHVKGKDAHFRLTCMVDIQKPHYFYVVFYIVGWGRIYKSNP